MGRWGMWRKKNKQLWESGPGKILTTMKAFPLHLQKVHLWNALVNAFDPDVPYGLVDPGENSLRTRPVFI